MEQINRSGKYRKPDEAASTNQRIAAQKHNLQGGHQVLDLAAMAKTIRALA
jgi:hypothetical protein